jgi:ATP-dependent helicase/nuclease subunit A
MLDPRCNVSVSASAGSGKTWQLVSRITRLLLEGASPDHILALTFTRKAAAEMRERVEDRLRQLALADDAALDGLLTSLQVAPTPALRSHARGLYEQLLFSPWPLRATTLHAFCQDLVARFPEQTGISAGFELVEQEAELMDGAWQALQSKLLAQPESLESKALDTLIAEEFNEWNIRVSVTKFLAQRSDWRSYTLNQEHPLDDAVEKLRNHLGLEDDPLSALTSASFENALTTLCETLKDVGKIRSVKAEQLLPTLTLTSDARYPLLCEILLTQKNEPRYFEPGKDAIKRLGARKDAMVEAFQHITRVLLHIHEQRLRAGTLRCTTAALTLGIAALAELEQECRQRNCLTFADLEWFAYRLLSDRDIGPWVQFKLDQRVDHLLLDEFQDTSGTQWQLLLPLLEEMAAGNDERPRSAFIVGDLKQSIYGFRRANSDLLPQATRWMQEHLNGVTATLAQSYRSTPAIIEWVNALFAEQALLKDFPLHSTTRAGWGRVELAAAIAPAAEIEESAPEFRDPLTTAREDPEDARAHDEGRLIATRIQRLVESRWQIDAQGGARALDYGDVLILIRQRTHSQPLEEELTRAGIPFIGVASGTLLQTLEARDLLALLRFLLSPVNALALAHALRSPIFGATDADLNQLALTARQHDGDWYRALQEQTHTPVLTRAAQLLERWLNLAQRLPVHDLLDCLCNEGNLARRYEAALPQAQAVRARGNLNAVIQLALEADGGRYPSLSAFLQELERWIDRKDAPDEAPPPASSGQVRILTVHGAKGLEAPAVFLAQCATTKNPDTSGWLVEWPAQETAPTHFLLAPSKDEQDAPTRALLELRKQREDIENLNLLYVAVTRARQFLFISGYSAKKNSKDLSWHQLADAAFDRLGIEAVEGVRVFAQGEPSSIAATPPMPSASPTDPRLRQPLRFDLAQSGEKDEPQLDALAARRGQAIHWLIQQLSDARENRLRGRLEAQITGVVSDTDFNAWLAEARAVLAAPSLRKFFDATTYRQAWNEQTLHDGESTRVLDRLVDDGAALWVLDYKTQRDAEDAGVLALHRAQLESYRRGVQALWPGRSVRAGLVLTDAARWLELEMPK